MEFVLSITSREQILNTLCQGINIGIKGYSFDNIYNIDIIELAEYIDITKTSDKKLFISLNRIFHEQEFDNIIGILSNPLICEVEGIYFSDLGLVEIANKYNIVSKLIYTPETLLTNRFEIEALKDSNISSFTISNEIAKEDIRDIISLTDVKLTVIGFGYISMFYSKRKLITLYNDSNEVLTESRDGFIVEETRSDNYPILEGDYGTHIYRSKIFSIHSELEYFNDIDYIRIDAYKIDNDILNAAEIALIKGNMDKLEQHFNLIDDGFLNTKTIYKKVSQWENQNY